MTLLEAYLRLQLHRPEHDAKTRNEIKKAAAVLFEHLCRKRRSLATSYHQLNANDVDDVIQALLEYWARRGPASEQPNPPATEEAVKGLIFKAMKNRATDMLGSAYRKRRSSLPRGRTEDDDVKDPIEELPQPALNEGNLRTARMAQDTEKLFAEFEAMQERALRACSPKAGENRRLVLKTLATATSRGQTVQEAVEASTPNFAAMPVDEQNRVRNRFDARASRARKYLLDHIAKEHDEGRLSTELAKLFEALVSDHYQLHRKRDDLEDDET